MNTRWRLPSLSVNLQFRMDTQNLEMRLPNDDVGILQGEDKAQ